MNDFERIKLLLWSEWDPIGVNGWGGPEDEYDSYAPRVLRMAQEGASVEAIAAYLDEVVVARIGMRPDSARSRAVAAKARSLLGLTA